jgi:hypothetical protein
LLQLAAIGLVGVFATMPVAAQSSPPPGASEKSPAEHVVSDEWLVNLGAFVLSTNISGDLSGAASGSNQEIDFSHDFGTDANATRVRADILWRITPRHHVRLLYFNNNVERTRTIDTKIDWGDYEFPANASVTAQSKFSVYEGVYEYAFMRDPTYEVAASIGVHFEDITLKLAGEATVYNPDGTILRSGNVESKSSSVPAPLPVIGLRGGWAVADNWYLDLQGQFFRFKVDQVDGNWFDLRADATYMFNRHWGLGLGYNRFNTHVDLTKPHFNGRLNLGYSGLLAFVTGSF